MRILSEHGASEPLWSVKWIVQHVLRENPLDKVHNPLCVLAHDYSVAVAAVQSHTKTGTIRETL